MPSASNFLV